METNQNLNSSPKNLNIGPKTSTNPMRIAIIGFGLIGSSITKALNATPHRSKYHISVYEREDRKIDKKLRELLSEGLIDSLGESNFSDLNKIDFVVLCTHVGMMRDIFKRMKPFLNPECIITDCGSTKDSVLSDAEEVFGSLPHRFVPAHPLAGSEITGFNSGVSYLFKNKLCLICAHPQTNKDAITKVRDFWLDLGARVENCDLYQHDHLLAHTSHLPHLLSYCLVNVLLDCDKDILDFASSGFADISRLASSDADLWIDILLSNKKKLFIALDDLQKDLSIAKEKLEQEDIESLREYFLRAKSSRDAHIKKYPDIFKNP